MKNILFISFILIFFSSAYSQNIKLQVDKQKSEISYSASHPLHDWKGVSKEMKAVIVTDAEKNNILNTAISVPVVSFNSENSNRDSHMVEVTEAIKYPNITFTSTSISKKSSTLTVTGNLTFHGVKKLITTAAEMKKNKEIITISGEFPVKMSDYKIERPSLMGISSSDDMKINFNLIFK